MTQHICDRCEKKGAVSSNAFDDEDFSRKDKDGTIYQVSVRPSYNDLCLGCIIWILEGQKKASKK